MIVSWCPRLLGGIADVHEASALDPRIPFSVLISATWVRSIRRLFGRRCSDDGEGERSETEGDRECEACGDAGCLVATSLIRIVRAVEGSSPPLWYLGGSQPALSLRHQWCVMWNEFFFSLQSSKIIQSGNRNWKQVCVIVGFWASELVEESIGFLEAWVRWWQKGFKVFGFRV